MIPDSGLNPRSLTHIPNSNQIGSLIPKGSQPGVMKRFFGKIEPELAEGEAREATRGISADRQIVFEASVSTLRAIVSFSCNSIRVSVKVVNEMR